MAIKSNKIRRPLRKYGVGGGVSGIIGSIGSIYGVVDSVATPIRENVETVDPETGGFKDSNLAVGTSAVGGALNPLKAVSEANKYGSKWNAIETVFNPIGGAMRATKQKNEYLKEQKRRKDYSNSIIGAQGGSYNPYTPLMPYGGQVGSEEVELEQGEPYMTPDGQIQSIPTTAPTHAQGGVPITLPEGTKVLGKKSTFDKKQYKVLGRQLEKAQKKYDKELDTNPTSVGANTAKRMLKNIQTDYNKLFQDQGVDVGGRQFAEGGAVTTQRGISTPNYRNDTETTFYQQMYRHGIMNKGDNALSIEEQNNRINKFYNTSEGMAAPYRIIKGEDGKPIYQKDHGRFKGEMYDTEGNVIDTYNKPRGQLYAKGGKVLRKGSTGLLSGENQSPDLYNWPTLNNYTYSNNPIQYQVDNNTDTREDPLWNQQIKKPLTINSTNTNSKVNWSNAATTVGTLTPIAYNLIQGSKKADSLNANDYYNPYINNIRQDMRNRRYDVRPELEQNATDTATYYRQLKESGVGQAQLMGGYQLGLINKYRANAGVLSRKQNVDSQYLADQAQMDANLGQSMANTKMSVKDINDKNQAARINYNAAAMNQIGQFSQIKQQENNQMIRDAQRMNLLPALVQNFTLTPDGQWVHKQSGQVATKEQIMSYIKGTNV